MKIILSLVIVLYLSGCGATFTASKDIDPETNFNEGIVLVSFDQDYSVIKWMYRNLNSGKGAKGVTENFITTTDSFNDLIIVNNRIIYHF